MNIKSAELLFNIINVLIAYVVSAPLIGYTKAYVAKKMGDDTPEQFGFLTFNPFMHMSRFWIILIVFFQYFYGYTPIALGVYMPLSPGLITGKYRKLKTIIAFFSDFFAAFFCSVFSFWILILIHRGAILKIIGGAVNFKQLLQVAPDLSSLSVVVTSFFMTFYIMTSVMATFSLILNTFHCIFFYSMGFLKDNPYADMIMLFGPLALLFLSLNVVNGIVLKIVTVLAYLFGMCCGLV